MNRKIFGIAVGCLIIDQVSKILISMFFLENESFSVIPHFFSLQYLENYGAAWSIFSYRIEFLIFVSFIALVILFRYLYHFQLNKRNNIAFGLLFGGICGNLIDRLFVGYVRDFLSFKIWGYSYPVFNFADTFIVIGVFLLVIAIMKGEDKIGENSKS